MRHTVAFSDTHIHDDSRLDYISALCDYVATRKPPLLVLVGDIADPWHSKWQDILETNSWKRLCQLVAARAENGLETIYIRGNHDNAIKKKHLKGNHYRGANAKQMRRVKLRWKHTEGAFLFTHGWEWDSRWGRLPGQILFWISRNAPFLMIPFYNFWSKWQHSTPSTLKSEGNADEWSASTQAVHDRAQVHARKNALTVVLGHTHFPRMTPFIVDAGDWEDSFSLVEIAGDGTVALKHLIDGRMKELTMEDRVYSEIPVMWPKKKTAFLVIHGCGPHRPYETLDRFARGFRHALKIQNPQLERKVRWKHELQEHRGRESWVQSMISLSLDGHKDLDFYEYYWDCYMVRAITPREVLEWLDTASDGACRFYKCLPRKAEEYESMGVNLFGDGEFTFRGYRILLGPFRRTPRAVVLLLRNVNPLLRWASKRIECLMGDVVIYTTSDVRSANYETRQKMLDGAVEELRQLLESKLYDRIVVVGHSLGSVIAYDALNRLVLETSLNGKPSPELTKTLSGLVTFGSPLDKIAFFFEERTRDESFVQRQILSQLHGFRRVAVSTSQEPIAIGSPIKDSLEDLRWLNFFHLKDRLGGSLDAYEVHQNILCTAKAKNSGEAHDCYWTWDQMYKDIANHFFTVATP